MVFNMGMRHRYRHRYRWRWGILRFANIIIGLFRHRHRWRHGLERKIAKLEKKEKE